LKKGATAGLSSSAEINSPKNTAEQASSGTQILKNRLFQQAASAKKEPGGGKNASTARLVLIPEILRPFRYPSDDPTLTQPLAQFQEEKFIYFCPL
jgi:hypothetical protein